MGISQIENTPPAVELSNLVRLNEFRQKILSKQKLICTIRQSGRKYEREILTYFVVSADWKQY